jgi:acyl-CoA synthetase (AMP-forming)/AMP-acid ligase II
VSRSFNLADLFELVAAAIPEREALTCGARRESYAELDERATRLADAFDVKFGVRRGDHVGLDLYNCCEYVEAMLACWKLRAVPINVNYRYVAAELSPLFDNADLVGVVCDAHTEADARSAAGARWVIRTGEEFDTLVASGSPSRTFATRSADDHYVLYTGGTTGMPRGVVWRHEDIFFTALGSGNPGGPPITTPEEISEHARTNRVQRLAPYLPDGDRGCEEFVALSLSPLMHAGGQWMGWGTLLGGGRVVLYDAPHLDLATVLDLVERERIVMVSLIGDAAARPLVELLEANAGNWDTSSVRMLGSGAAILTAEMRERLLAALPTVLAINEAVGSSEAPVTALATAVRGAPTIQSLAFTARQGVTIVLDDDLRPVEPGSGVEGWLAAGGRVPIGYYNDPEKSARTFVTVDGVRYSIPGDRALIEADGTIRLLGRGALCINTGGEKVYPEEVEAVLKAHPAIDDAIVVGLPDERFGQQVAAVVASRQSLALEDMQAHCRDSLAGYKVPRSITVVPAIERSPAGKADYGWATEIANSRQ